MSWDEYAVGWDDEPAVRAYAEAAFGRLVGLAEEGVCRLDGARVLDFGCGTGLLTEKLAPQAAEVVALDPSAEMAKVVDAKRARHGWAHVVVLPMTLERAREEAPERFVGAFDLVVCSSVCAFLDDYQGSAQALVDTLAPAGAFVQLDWEWKAEDEEPFGFTREQVGQTLREVGLEGVRVETAFEVDVEGATMRPIMGLGQAAR